MWEASGSTLSDKIPAPEEAVGGADPRQFVGGVPEVSYGERVETARLEAALKLAREGKRILAVWGCFDGVCDCPKGSECSSVGKHPYPRFCPNGVYSATNDEATIRMWHAKDPRINFAEATGETIVVDVDPRNDGDASYYDLGAAHGPGAFPATREKATGGGGWHKKYRLPETIKARKGELKCKLGPGVDVKAAGGYILCPLSSHESGRPYGPENELPEAECPEWIVAELRKAAEGGQAAPAR